MVKFSTFLCLLLFVVTCVDVHEVMCIKSTSLGPLRVSTSNPRYFANGNNEVVYLTGSHVWDNFQDWGGSIPDFNYTAYLDFLKAHNHNFIRLWKIGESTQKTHRKGILINPMPWQRTGPGLSNDGQPKFDLTKFEHAYFDRLRYRVSEAGKRGIYVSVMFFDGIFEWKTHPFNDSNNINKVGADSTDGGDGSELFTLRSKKTTDVQKAYIRKVIDTVNDLDNVLYEVGNEIKNSTEWQYHIINYINSYQKTKPKQHPVGMTSTGENGPGDITNTELFNSPADWISPGSLKAGQDYSYNPPAANGRKVIISDTDHLSGIVKKPSPEWVWRSFLRGLNPVLMDVLQNSPPGANRENDPDSNLTETRLAMGQTLRYAERLNLAKIIPHPELASSGYCLANPGSEYLIYQPFSDFRGREKMLQKIGIFGRKLWIDLRGASGMFRIEWFNPLTDEVFDGGTVSAGSTEFLRIPFTGDSVLYLYRGD